MRETGPATAARAALREEVGVAIPVYFTDEADAAAGLPLLADTLAGCVALVDARRVTVVLDGSGAGTDAASRLVQARGARFLALDERKGKLWAQRSAAEQLLQDAQVRWVALLDCDGDHFPHELPAFLRMGRHVAAAAGTDRVHVLGRRASRHRSLGFVRAEFEALADRVLLDALQYDAAMRGAPLRLTYATALEEYPDFHSGYKVLSRAAAQDVFLSEPRLAGLSERAYWRHACEAVLVVETVLAGAVLATVQRGAHNEQPVSAFARLDRARLVADKILWPCRRLGVPAAFVAQWLENHAPRLLLGALAPQGREELGRVCDLVLGDLGMGQATRPDHDPLRPPFL